MQLSVHHTQDRQVDEASHLASQVSKVASPAQPRCPRRENSRQPAIQQTHPSHHPVHRARTHPPFCADGWVCACDDLFPPSPLVSTAATTRTSRRPTVFPPVPCFFDSCLQGCWPPTSATHPGMSVRMYGRECAAEDTSRP